MDSKAIAKGCKALGHPVRLKIIELLAGQTECRGADVFGELPLAQSTVSQHLGILKDAGIVSVRPVGTSAVYCLVPEALESLSAEIAELSKVRNTCRSVHSSERTNCE